MKTKIQVQSEIGPKVGPNASPIRLQNWVNNQPGCLLSPIWVAPNKSENFASPWLPVLTVYTFEFLFAELRALKPCVARAREFPVSIDTLSALSASLLANTTAEQTTNKQSGQQQGRSHPRATADMTSGRCPPPSRFPENFIPGQTSKIETQPGSKMAVPSAGHVLGEIG